MTFSPVAECRSCGHDRFHPVLDLGDQPLANAFKRAENAWDEPRYPLALVCCAGCSLVQLTGTVPPRLMFDNYHYFSSYSETMVEEMRKLATRTATELSLGVEDLIVEVASNDGYLLQHYVHLGIPVLGIEPAANVADVAVANGVPTLVEYFGTGLAERVRGDRGPASVMHANNVMAHVPDINDFVAGFAILLAEDGVAIVESPYLGRFIEDCEFDTTYHEHVFYYSLTALDRLVRPHGLVVSDVEHLAIHGGTLRCFIRRSGTPVNRKVPELLAEEAALGVSGAQYYADFADRVAALEQSLTGLLLGLKSEGASIVGYGAAAKGTVLLNHFGIGRQILDGVVDVNPHKQGLVMPGVHVPISAPELLLRDQPTHVLLLAWNFADEIMAQQAEYARRGGKFIIPVPEPKVV